MVFTKYLYSRRNGSKKQPAVFDTETQKAVWLVEVIIFTQFGEKSGFYPPT